MTPEQEKQKARLDAAYKELREAMNSHDCYPERIGSSMRCPVCKQSFGWHCPNSQDNLCNYDPPGNSDDCNYCHEPHERK
jgi:hypothetical protein